MACYSVNLLKDIISCKHLYDDTNYAGIQSKYA